MLAIILLFILVFGYLVTGMCVTTLWHLLYGAPSERIMYFVFTLIWPVSLLALIGHLGERRRPS